MQCGVMWLSLLPSGNHGIPRKLYFFLTPSYWWKCGRRQRPLATADEEPTEQSPLLNTIVCWTVTVFVCCRGDIQWFLSSPPPGCCRPLSCPAHGQPAEGEGGGVCGCWKVRTVVRSALSSVLTVCVFSGVQWDLFSSSQTSCCWSVTGVKEK